MTPDQEQNQKRLDDRTYNVLTMPWVYRQVTSEPPKAAIRVCSNLAVFSPEGMAL